MYNDATSTDLIPIKKTPITFDVLTKNSIYNMVVIDRAKSLSWFSDQKNNPRCDSAFNFVWRFFIAIRANRQVACWGQCVVNSLFTGLSLPQGELPTGESGITGRAHLYENLWKIVSNTAIHQLSLGSWSLTVCGLPFLFSDEKAYVNQFTQGGANV